MKKIYFLLVALMAMVMTSCGINATEGETEETTCDSTEVVVEPDSVFNAEDTIDASIM